jgi:branched-chain amino acid transport system ATP-binding protein
MPILQINNLSRSFGGLRAVDDVSFDIEPGTINSLVGPNGAGKTTLFNLVSRIFPTSSGRLFFNGADITSLKTHQVAQRGLGRTFQDPRMFFEMTVLEHVLTGFSLPDENPLLGIVRSRRTRSLRRDALAQAHVLLEQIGLGGRANELAQDLSFGEQRFLSIARTLAGNPTLILLDEPSVGLDGNDIDKLKRMIISLAREHGKTFLIIEHNLDVIFDISDQIHLLVSGKIALSGTTDELKRHPTMIEAYLGDAHAALSA